MITVDEKIRQMGYEPTPALCWAAGQMIAARWRRIHGTEPEKQLRAKTSRTPSVPAPHMKCVYPARFYPVMEEIIRDLDPEHAPQFDMFGHGS